MGHRLTQDLPTKTKYLKIGVADSQGQYVPLDLAKVTYKVWVRGYGLVDSNPVDCNQRSARLGVQPEEARRLSVKDWGAQNDRASRQSALRTAGVSLSSLPGRLQ
jgi:hypothetical protein